MDMGEEIFHLVLHRGVGLIGGREFVCMLGGGCCAFVLVYLEARHHFIYDGVGIVESQFVNRFAGFSELKVSFSEVVFEVIPCFVRRIGVFSRSDVIFENSLFVKDNEGNFYFLTLV